MKDQNREILLVTGSSNTQRVIAQQLNQYFNHEVRIVPYMVDEQNPKLTGKYFTIFSSEEVRRDFFRQGNAPHTGEDYLVARRTVMPDKIEQILLLPRGEKILLVSDSEESAKENIESLCRIGLDFLELVPYAPGSKVDLTNIRLAITPGEANLAPPQMEEVYNIGVRIIALGSLIQILRRLDLLDGRVQRFADIYMESVVNFSRRVSTVANDTIRVNQTVRREFIGKGYYAKYRFPDIIGKTQEICQVRQIAEKIAATNLTVLIEGENGTGKELFASAIHNASSRVRSPFLAINLSALPDELVESELFGYEEGSFTGARKGGKPGLFQQANGGTIFLDEIGDVSLRMQAKLLRVIQEKEIMRVGGDRIIPVDVRIIAATNRDLKKMIAEGSFRKDLYYRLKMGYIHIPSLRERREDVPLLVQDWLKKKASGGRVLTVDGALMQHFLAHDWPGNVRELQNTLEYAAAISEDDRITTADMPYDSFDEVLPGETKAEADTAEAELHLDPVSQRILHLVTEMNERGELASQRRVMEELRAGGMTISDYKLRKLLKQLMTIGRLRESAGSYGLEAGNFRFFG